MNKDLPGIVVTGASGFVGRHFLAHVAGRYRLFCLARRSRQEAGIPQYENMRWTQVDVARWDTMRKVIQCVKEHGGAEYVVHLAGYYDFHNMEHPEYERTNVDGTRNVLKLARQLGIKRFVFASSLAACRFPPPGGRLDEDAVADADFPYARSKRRGEEMIHEDLKWFPSAIVRMAAVYSDWCEYAPLYVFLRTWLSERWNARLLGGRGESAVTYIHIQDLVKLLARIVERSDDLPRIAVYNASTEEPTSHRQLYEAATSYFYGEAGTPRGVPRWLCGPALSIRFRWGRMTGRPPLEAPWMAEYIDRQMRVDTSRTRAALDWAPAPRLDLRRRLLLLIENMKSHGEIWHQRNEQALHRVARRPNLLIADYLEDMRELVLDRLLAEARSDANAVRFRQYREMEPEELRWFLVLVYQVLITSTRTRDRRLMREYAHVIAARRRGEQVPVEQVQDFLAFVGGVISEELRKRPALSELGQHLYDNVTLSFQLAADGVADAYETMEEQSVEPSRRFGDRPLPATTNDLEHMVRQLEDICDETLPARLWAGR